jgi:hypothetical protein
VKWYWIITCDNTVANPLVTDSDNFEGLERELFLGRRLDIVPRPLHLQTTKADLDGDPDDALQNHLALPVVSERLHAAMVGEGIKNVQYLPVKVLSSNGTLVGTFSLLNVLDVKDALNRAESDYDVYPEDYFLSRRRGMIRALRKPVLRRDALGSSDLIRLLGYPYQLYASQNFKQLFEDGRFTGWSLREIKVQD